jgi:hypothetical protein
MYRLLTATVLVLLAAGCNAASQSADSTPAASETEAAAGPNLILELTTQTSAWKCPTCGMVFDGPGECSMKDGTLKEITIAYACPTDGEVFQAGGNCAKHNVAIEAKVAFVDGTAESGKTETQSASGHGG